MTGDYAASFVSAMQSGGRPAAAASGPDLPGSNVATPPLPDGRLAVSACCKHFDAYSLESWEGVERYGFDAQVDAQDLADTYLPAFRECVVTGGSSCIMCAYNAVNGVPMCANAPFLTELARGAWGFATFCVPCHAADGSGAGLVAKKAGWNFPIGYTDSNAGKWADGYLFHIVSYGRNNMPRYASQINQLDRWKIILHLRALQQQNGAAPVAVEPAAAATPSAPAAAAVPATK